MEVKSLVLGLVFSLTIFAVKSGAGLAYLLQSHRSWWFRLLALAGYIGSYALLFILVWFLGGRVDFMAHMETVMLFFKNGMTIHFILAVLLLLWGGALLDGRCGCDGRGSLAWLLLVLPCPVCFSVVLASAVFLQALWPDDPLFFVWLATAFIGVGLVMAGLMLQFSMKLYCRQTTSSRNDKLSCFVVAGQVNEAARFRSDPAMQVAKKNAEHDLGLVMVGAALYFLLTIILVPQFADAARIYRLGLVASSNGDTDHLAWLLLGGVLLFCCGFGKDMGKLK